MKQHFAKALTQSLTILISAILPVLVTGCGGPDEFRHLVYPSGGVVTKAGTPVANATVIFHPVDPKTIQLPAGKKGIEIAKPTTTTDKDGKFDLSTYLAKDGAPAGEYKVTVLLSTDKISQKTGELVTVDDEEKAPHSSVQATSALTKSKSANKFSVLETTTLQATIKPTGENSFAFTID